MSRVRCVKFYWAKFCRLIRYYKCVEACRLIKQKMTIIVNKIQIQYKAMIFRRKLIVNIKNKKIIKI